MKKILVGFSSLFLATLFSFGQNDTPAGYCGYSGISDWLVEYQANKDAFPIPQRKGAITYIPMTVHILGTDDGAGYFSEKQVIDAFCTLNRDFLPTDIQFYLAREFNYINNSEWYDHDFSGGRNMMNQNNFPGTINTYIVNDPAGNCGYFSPGPDALAIKKSCSGANDHTWAHEVGHYLSLPHPFVGWEGRSADGTAPAPSSVGNRPVERVDRSNCRQAADGFCDTGADYISDRWTCNVDGESRELIDPTGEVFRADGTLFMSYSNDQCANRFSGEQVDAMLANLFNRRTDLLTNPTPIDKPGTQVVAITPAEGETVPVGDVVLSWEPVQNATRYIVEVVGTTSLVPRFFREVVVGTEVTVPNLSFERPHYWRVYPFNEFHFCSDYSDLFSFNIASSSSVDYIESVNGFSVSPIPAASGSRISINISSSENFEGKAKLVNLTGQVIGEKNYQISPNDQQLDFDLPEIAQGVYLLSFENEKGERMVRKLVID